MPPVHPHLGLASLLADRARELLADGIAGFGRATTKADGTPVTAADRECELALREIITEKAPGHGVWGEEFGRDDNATLWVLDPIDGTKAFITGSPMFSTLIGLVEDGRPTLGIVEFPALARRYVGAGNQALMYPAEGRPHSLYGSPRGPTTLADANVATTAPPTGKAAQAIVAGCAQVRYGGDAHNFMAVAAGGLDLAVDEGLAPHDYAAVLPILEAARCAWANFQGDRPAFGGQLDLVVAGNAALLEAALAAAR